MRQIPNILSFFRIIIAPVFFFMLISEKSEIICLSLPVFVIGAITDYFDGWFARKMKAVTKFGKFFDPLADKFLTGFAFLGFVVLSIIPLWMVLVVIFRDVLTTLMRFFPTVGKNLIETSKAAKYKTFIQMIYIFIVLILITMVKCNSSLFDRQIMIDLLYSNITKFSMLIIVLLSLFTLYDYTKSLKSANE